MQEKIIFECLTGSSLYGTRRPESDLDVTGVFIHSKDQLHDLMTGIQNPPSEFSQSVKLSKGPRNEAGDVDKKYWSLQKFVKMATEGQPGALEMMFAPAEVVLKTSPEWDMVMANRHLFLSQKQSLPFIGFASSQAHKSEIKGENLTMLRLICEWGNSLSKNEKLEPVSRWLYEARPDIFALNYPNGKSLPFLLKIEKNLMGFKTLRIAGRQYDPGLKTKTFIESVTELVGRYGTRSAEAAAKGRDFKSLMHAERLLNELQELVQTGKITLPRPDHEVTRLLNIRSGNVDPAFDWHSNIMSRVDEIKLFADSPLPLEPDRMAIKEMIRDMLLERLVE